jgi:hypothetical protein
MTYAVPVQELYAAPVAFAAPVMSKFVFLDVELHVGWYEPVVARVVATAAAGAVHDENDCIHEVYRQ